MNRGSRRRALVLLSLALASGGLAASQVHRKSREVEARVGPLVPVLVTREDVAAGTELSPRNAARMLGLREVPERFAPRDSLSSPEDVLGLRTAVPLIAGAYLTTGQLEPEGEAEAGEAALGRGERVVEVAVAGGEGLGSAAGSPNARVDVLVTTEPRAASGRTYLALEAVELLGIRPAGAEPQGEGASAAGGTLATLRVTLRQAVYLTAAQNFARELRLLPRPRGDRRRSGRTVVEGPDL